MVSIINDMAIKPYLFNVPIDTNVRIDCPYCNGTNCFTISKTIMDTKWNCYRAGCNIAGFSTNTKFNKDSLLQIVKGKKFPGEVERIKPLRNEIVDRMEHPFTTPESTRYFTDMHCTEAWVDSRADLRYDPVMKRAVFLIKHEGVVVDAVGRTLLPKKERKKLQPVKWYHYGDSGLPLKIQGGNHLRNKVILVEDAASACAASCMCDAVALCGTTVASQLYQDLFTYDEIIIALDPDAQFKAISLHRLLSFIKPTKVWLIWDDLKYFTNKDLRDMATAQNIFMAEEIKEEKIGA